MLKIARAALALAGAYGSLAVVAVAAAPLAPATARVHIEGTVHVDRDVAVKHCDANPAGHSLMSGYSVDLRGDDFVESGGVHVSAYNGDRRYTLPVKVAAFAEDPLQLSFRKSGAFARGSTLVQNKTSTLTVTIADHGKSGVAAFKNWHLLYPDGAVASGTLTWRCP